jgi:hypothetical protein
MRAKNFPGFLTAVCLTTCASVDSITDLLNTPAQFENRKITVRGFLHLDSTRNVIYSDKTDFEERLDKNGLLLVFNDTLAFDHNELNHRTVEIDGIFKRTSTGSFSGQLVDVTRVEKRGR